MNKVQFLNSADKLNTVEFIPFMIGISWILVSVVGVTISLGWIVVSLLR